MPIAERPFLVAPRRAVYYGRYRFWFEIAYILEHFTPDDISMFCFLSML
jgi:hypothetical protein